MNAKKELYTPPSGPPPANPRLANVYPIMGEDNIFKMLEDFYLELGNSEIRAMFPEDMALASRKSAEFFVFLLGGPPLYQQRHGAPMMRHRHMAFVIDEHARKIWLNSFYTILNNADKKYAFPIEYIDDFKLFLDKFSGWMVNTG